MVKASEKENKDSQHEAWVSRGVDSVYYQRETQVAWWTILGGIAVAALLTEVDNVFMAVRNQRWQLLLFFFASAMIIVNAWIQMAWAGLILKLPISIPISVIYFTQGILLSLISLNVTNPSLWMALAGCLPIWAILTTEYFKRIDAWIGFTDDIKSRAKSTFFVYLTFIFICVGGFINLHYFPSTIAEIIWGFVALISSIMALWNQHIVMIVERKDLGIP